MTIAMAKVCLIVIDGWGISEETKGVLGKYSGSVDTSATHLICTDLLNLA